MASNVARIMSSGERGGGEEMKHEVKGGAISGPGK